MHVWYEVARAPLGGREKRDPHDGQDDGNSVGFDARSSLRRWGIVSSDSCRDACVQDVSQGTIFLGNHRRIDSILKHFITGIVGVSGAFGFFVFIVIALIPPQCARRSLETKTRFAWHACVQKRESLA